MAEPTLPENAARLWRRAHPYLPWVSLAVGLGGALLMERTPERAVLVVAAAVGAWTLAVQFADYPLENRGRPFRDTLTLLRANRAAALGFGACATLALAVPLVNFLLVPVAVAGGTLLWLRLDAQENP